MVRWFVGASLRGRGLVVALAAGLIVFGAVQLRSMPRDVLPEFTPPTVHIQSEALGLSAIEVEELITSPFEQDLLNGVPFLAAIRSESAPGLSSIELFFEPGTDIYRARQVVQERLSEAVIALPGASKPPQMLQPVSSTNRVMMIALRSDDVSLIDMSVLARWTIRPRLLGVSGVANVAVWGNRDQQIQVQVDPERLAAHDVSLQQIIESAGNALWVSPLSFLEASTPGTGGFIDTPNQRLQVQHLLPVKTPEDLAKVTIEGTETEPIALGDVASVVEDHQPLIGNAVLADGPGLLLVVEKFPEADINAVTAGLDEALRALAPGLKGITIDSSVFRPADYISTASRNVGWTMLIGFVIAVALVTALFAGRRRAIIVAVSIPAALMVAVLVLRLAGATLNVMTAAGLVMAAAIMIDDAVAGADASSRRLRRREDGADIGGIVMDAVIRARAPLGFAAAIAVLISVTSFLLEGIPGSFLTATAAAFAIAVLASMLVAVTLGPALAAMLLDGDADDKELRGVRGVRRGLARTLPPFTHSPKPAALLMALAVAGFIVVPFLRHASSPGIKERDILIDLEAAPGTSLDEMNRIVSRVAAELRATEGVDHVGSQVGRAITSDRVVNVNTGEIWVGVSPDASYERTVTTVRRIVAGYPGLDHDVGTFSRERILDELTGAENPVTVRVFGPDLDTIEKKAAEVAQAIRGIDGVDSANAAVPAREPTLEVEVDLAKARTVGLTPGEVRRAAATLLSGLHVGSLFEEQKVFDVVVWGTPETRFSLPSVHNLKLEAAGGRMVRLGDVAAVRMRPNPTAVRHESSSRAIDVTATVHGRSIGAVLDDVEKALAGIDFPLEHHAEVIGDFSSQQAARTRFIAFAIAAALGILLLVQAAVRSWRLAGASMLVFALSLSGGAVAVALTGGVLTLGSIAGLVLVLVIAIRHGLTLVSRYQRMQMDGPPLDDKAIVRGALNAAPATATSMAAVAALFLPVALAGPREGLEIIQPMAVVLLGGLATTAAMIGYVMPAVFLWLGRTSETELERTLLEESHALPQPDGEVIVLDEASPEGTAASEAGKSEDVPSITGGASPPSDPDPRPSSES